MFSSCLLPALRLREDEEAQPHGHVRMKAEPLPEGIFIIHSPLLFAFQSFYKKL